MGRWKSDGKGGAYYDPNDSGPDQVAAPVRNQAAQGQSTSAPQVEPTRQQQTTTQAPTAQEDFGNPVYNQIADFFRQYGVTPTLQLVSQWGTNVDQNYLRAIAAKIQQTYGGQSTTSTAPTTAPASTGAPLTADQIFANLRRDYPGGTLADLQQAQKDHPDWFSGGSFSGSHGDKFTIGGKTYDMVIASGVGGRGWNFSDITGGGGDSSTGTGGVNPSYLQPFTAPFDPSKAVGVPDWAKSVPEWKPPDYNTLMNDPEYLFARQQGEQAINRTNAAKGILNTGGNIKDIIDFNQGNATKFAQQLRNNSFQDWTAKYGANQDAYAKAWQQYVEGKDTFYRNQNEPFNKLYKTTSIGAQAAAA